MFKKGDRVKAIVDSGLGLREGEYGTVIGYDYWGDPLVYWDEYNPARHNGDGEVSEGHGWYVSESMIAFVQECIDFGDLPVAAEDVSKFLFDM